MPKSTRHQAYYMIKTSIKQLRWRWLETTCITYERVVDVNRTFGQTNIVDYVRMHVGKLTVDDNKWYVKEMFIWQQQSSECDEGSK